ncbi:MAG: 6-phosphofructokinase [Planctomycetaceae bacterium]
MINNNAVRGIVETARQMDEIGTVYAGWHGIGGAQRRSCSTCPTSARKRSLSARHPQPGPSALPVQTQERQDEDFDRVMDVFKAHDIGYFCYVGGWLVHTAYTVANLARERGLDVCGLGGPKTIDNDVSDSEFKLVDHTPGYGSTARYWAHYIQQANEENSGSGQLTRCSSCRQWAVDRLYPRSCPSGGLEA